VTLSPPLRHDQRDQRDAIDRGSAELLIQEAKQRHGRRRFLIGAVLLAAVLVAVTSIFASRPNNNSSASITSVKSFIASMKRADETGFVATYRVKNFSIFQDGTIVFAQIPSPPGTKAVENKDGYSGSGKYSYIFYGSSGHLIRQWIIINTNVQACLKWPTSPDKNLACGRPGPYLPSNGYAEEGMGLIPPYVVNAVESNVGNGTIEHLSTGSSKKFGPLRCLTQDNFSPQTTCIDRSGYVVSWLDKANTTFSPGITLTKLSYHPTASNFAPLVKPTVAFVLPPV
jgi:hypothetical protein